jgi:hypothetical protein
MKNREIKSKLRGFDYVIEVLKRVGISDKRISEKVLVSVKRDDRFLVSSFNKPPKRQAGGIVFNLPEGYEQHKISLKHFIESDGLSRAFYERSRFSLYYEGEDAARIIQGDPLIWSQADYEYQWGRKELWREDWYRFPIKPGDTYGKTSLGNDFMGWNKFTGMDKIKEFEDFLTMEIMRIKWEKEKEGLARHEILLEFSSLYGDYFLKGEPPRKFKISYTDNSKEIRQKNGKLISGVSLQMWLVQKKIDLIFHWSKERHIEYFKNENINSYEKLIYINSAKKIKRNNPPGIIINKSEYQRLLGCDFYDLIPSMSKTAFSMSSSRVPMKKDKLKDLSLVKSITEMLSNGDSMLKISRDLGCGYRLVTKFKNQLKQK